MQPGEERCLEIEIIDDSVTERTYKYFHFTLGVYNNVPTNCQYGRITIQDNESKFNNEFKTVHGVIFGAWRYFHTQVLCHMTYFK